MSVNLYVGIFTHIHIHVCVCGWVGKLVAHNSAHCTVLLSPIIAFSHSASTHTYELS